MVLSLAIPFTAAADTSTASLNASTQPFKSGQPDEQIAQQKAAILQQLEVIEGKPKLHEALQNVAGNKEVAVIVHLSKKPVALEQGMKKLQKKSFSSTEKQQVKKNVKAQQAQVKKEMKAKKIQFKEGFAYDTVLNGFAATVQAKDLDKLLAIDGVTLIEPDTIVHALEQTPTSELEKEIEYTPAMDTSISFLGIEALWNEGYEGQGIKVAVLDTGIDKDHPDFAGIYKGGKNFIPNSSTYARERSEDDASETSPLDRPAHAPEFNSNGSAFYTSHGTHVAGTIAAIGNNPYGIKGIAPKVDLYAYRVLGAYGSGSTSGIIAAIEEAVLQEMDVINLSLGGGPNSETDGASFAINNAMMANVISVIATGNSGPNRGTMGTPATARLGIAVGNTTNPEAHHHSTVTIQAGDYQLNKTMNLMATTFDNDPQDQLTGTYEVVAIPGVGKPTDFEGIDVNGKVALIARGEIPFVDKIAAAKERGAVAILIHNFAGGTNAPAASGTFLGDAFEYIPTYDVSQTDGEALRAALSTTTGTISFSNFDHTMTTGDEVNSSSSRGPSTPNFDIKPDVSAPGTNIMSTIPMYKADFPDAVYDEAYTRKTGTSMATPHIAGIAALIKQANPDWDAFDVKVALSNTAKKLDTTKYDVFSQGAGRVQAYAAAHPEILAYALDEAVLDETGTLVDNPKGTITFGPQDLSNGDLSVTKQVRVKDTAGSGGTYNVSVHVDKTFKDAQVTVDQTSFTLTGEQLLNVTLTASETADTTAGDEIIGYIHITGDHTDISLPFAADFGGASAVQLLDYQINETDLSFNGDGVQDEATLSFTLTGDVGFNYIELWDIQNPNGGAYGDGYIGYLHASNSLAAGSYTLRIRGQYKPWSSDPATTIPDGLYTIDFTGQTVSGNPPIIGDYVGPIFVKSTAPVIEGTVADGVATGQVTDKYIDYNEVLADYGLNYNLNDKLKATYTVTKNGEAGQPTPFALNEDGSFSIPMDNLDASTDSVTVTIEDAAGNKGQSDLTIEAAPGPKTTTITLDDIAADLFDKKAKQVRIDVQVDNEVIVLAFDATVLQAIEASKKDLVIQQGEARYSFSKKAVSALVNKANGELTITIGQTDATDLLAAVSDRHYIAFATGVGENATPFNIQESYTIVLPIDEARVLNKNKLVVHNLDTSTSLKAKYNKGILEFSTNQTGTFVVVNE